MPVDTSIYNTHPAEPFNPLTTMSSYAGIAHQLGENQLQQQEIRGRQALGKAIQSSTNDDGSINTNLLTHTVSQDPDASWMALKVQHDAEAGNQLTPYIGKNEKGIPTPMQAPLPQVLGLNNQGQQVPPEVHKARKHLQALDDTLSSLVEDPDLTQDKIIHTTVDLMHHPDADFTSTDAASTLSGLPAGANGSPPSKDQLRQAAMQKLAQIRQTKQHLDTKYPPEPPSSPGTPTGLPAGYSENQSDRQKHFLEVQNEANSVPQENAVLNNILDISKSGVPTGTLVGEIYKKLASSGLVPKNISDTGAQLKTIQNHVSQLALAGGVPGSDARLEALENAKVSDKDLPQTIQTMIPFLLAVNKSKVGKAKFYRKTADNGLDPDKVTKAQSNWNENFDPRIFELRDLQKDPKALGDYVSHLSKEDRQTLLQKYQSSKKAGLLGE